MVATFFVISGRLGLGGFLSRAQVRALDRAGMDIGDHTAHHVDLTTIDDAHLKMETAGSRRALEKQLGHPVYWFCYPFGAQDARVAQAVKDAGFLLGYTTAGGTALTTSARLLEPRLHVGRASSPASVLSLAGV
jgi:peptidoglycan/xylan/chitin deacetylase (PgdA/CDA1 family)